jgi:thiol-disulfide isomerase/thioredoxin
VANPNIQVYDDLIAAVAKWLKRTDLSAQIPDFIQFAEEYFNNLNDLVAVDARRKQFIVTPTQAVFTGPTDMQQPIQAYMGGRPLDFFPIGWESQYAGGTVPQIANGYQIIGNTISLSVPQLGVLFQLDYYQTLEGLSTSNESNWLLQDSPTAYLAGTLHEAFGYVRDFEKAEYWRAKRDAAIETYVNNDVSGRFPSGQLTIRAG